MSSTGVALMQPLSHIRTYILSSKGRLGKSVVSAPDRHLIVSRGESSIHPNAGLLASTSMFMVMTQARVGWNWIDRACSSSFMHIVGKN